MNAIHNPVMSRSVSQSVSPSAPHTASKAVSHVTAQVSPQVAQRNFCRPCSKSAPVSPQSKYDEIVPADAINREKKSVTQPPSLVFPADYENRANERRVISDSTRRPQAQRHLRTTNTNALNHDDVRARVPPFSKSTPIPHDDDDEQLCVGYGTVNPVDNNGSLDVFGADDIDDADAKKAQADGGRFYEGGLKSAIKSVLLPTALLVLVWTASFFAYQFLQLLHKEHCSKNLFNAVFFANSSACVYLNKAIVGVETLSTQVLRTVSVSLAYTAYRSITHFVAFAPASKRRSSRN